jgi:hypothetical protein
MDEKALPGGENFFIFGLAAVCWAIWKVRNQTCFEKKTIKNASEVFYSVCLFLRYWAGLHSGDAQQVIQVGVEIMMQTVIKIFKKSPGKGVTALLTNDDKEEAEEDSSQGAGIQNPGGGVH